MLSVNERIEQLRKLMEERSIDIYYVPNADDHMSPESTADYFKCKSWLSGFSGESGCVVVTKDEAYLWTDGRYFTQAEHELEGTCVNLMRMGQKGVPTVSEYLVENTPENGMLGFDGKVVSARFAKMLSDKLNKKHAKLHVSEDLVGMIWEDRPSLPKEPLFVLNETYTGESVASKVARIRTEMQEKNMDVLVLASLEDPCWLLNIRGNDIECTPVPYAYAMVTAESVLYYVDLDKVNDDVKEYFEKEGIILKDYDEIADDLKVCANANIWVDLSELNAYMFACIATSNRIVDLKSPIQLCRAVKNEVEMKNTRNAHIKDGVAVTKFLYWLKHNVTKMEISEMSAQDYLYRLREAQDLYIEPSFPTISAYKGNAAMMHYSSSEETNVVLKDEGFLLVDSGGTYFDGSTDITRTISLGNVTEEEKKFYTLVLKGHLDLNSAIFLKGTTGQNLDILARKPLWDLSIDYQCGTGHGVGHVLGVHEGPHGIRWGAPRSGEAVALQEGMVVTNEPGVYLPHKLGIRIENELLVQKEEENFYGTWLKFEQLTCVPYDRDAIDVSYLDDTELKQLNAYHAFCYETVAPFLNEEEKAWLKEETKEITR